ncbi:transposase [Mesorhizobium sp. M0601]
MGEDSDEMLDLVAQAWQVMETIRPKYSCRTCDKIIQAPAPATAIARGTLSYAALAHIMMAKWGYHLPFYRQAQMMATKGVDIERSTLARSAGYAAALLDPIYNRIREIGRTRTKIHTDDTRLPSWRPATARHTRARSGFTSPTIATRVRRSRRSPGIAPPWAAPARS